MNFTGIMLHLDLFDDDFGARSLTLKTLLWTATERAELKDCFLCERSRYIPLGVVVMMMMIIIIINGY